MGGMNKECLLQNELQIHLAMGPAECSWTASPADAHLPGKHLRVQPTAKGLNLPPLPTSATMLSKIKTNLVAALKQEARGILF